MVNESGNWAKQSIEFSHFFAYEAGMSTFSSRRVVCCALVLFLSISPAFSQKEKDTPDAIGDATTQQWVKASAISGVMYMTFGKGNIAYLHFEKSGKGLKDPIPAFHVAEAHVNERIGKTNQFQGVTKFKIAEMPVVERPFGLVMGLASDGAIKGIAAQKNLVWLKLDGNNLTSAGLKEIAGLKQLRALDISGVYCREEYLKHFAGMKLEHFRINRNQWTDANLESYVGALDKPRELDLQEWKITDKSLKQLTGLKLKALQIPDSCKTDEGLKHYLAAVEVPSELDLSDWKMSEPGLASLAGMKLKSLRLPVSVPKTDAVIRRYFDAVEAPTTFDMGLYTLKLTDEGLKPLADHKSLRVVRFQARGITDAALKPLSGLTNLEELSIVAPDITDAGLQELAGLKSLRQLRLRSTSINGSGLKHLSGLTNLEWVNLESDAITNDALAYLAPFTKLNILVIESKVITDEGLKHLLALKGLKRIILSKTNVSRKALEILAPLRAETIGLPESAYPLSIYEQAMRQRFNSARSDWPALQVKLAAALEESCTLR